MPNMGMHGMQGMPNMGMQGMNMQGMNMGIPMGMQGINPAMINVMSGGLAEEYNPSGVQSGGGNHEVTSIIKENYKIVKDTYDVLKKL